MAILAIAIAIAIGLAGCAGQTIKEKMGSYSGQPASSLIAKLGYPTDQQAIAGQKVYIWSNSRLVEGTTSACKIRAIIDAQDIIVSWDYVGNEGACWQYASALSR
jgi:hypothetical protein